MYNAMDEWGKPGGIFMDDQLLNWLWRNKTIVGITAIVISIVTWTVDLTGLVYECPFCRTQRTVISLLGILYLMPNPTHWISRWFASVFAALGLVVGGTQHFRGWVRIMNGEFEWGEQWYVNSWMLSGFALFIITGLLLLVWSWREDDITSAEDDMPVQEVG